MEEKIKKIVEALEGITYEEWKKISTSIETSYKKQADTITKKLEVPALENIISTYKGMFY